MADTPNVLITGGAGFIGTNLAKSFLDEGREITILDNMSRRGVAENLDFLQTRYKGRVHFIAADVRDKAAVWNAASRADVIFHFAAQVAVTTSLDDPMADFAVNAIGTLNVLEAARLSERRPTVLFTSTNKVYGSLEDLSVVQRASRYEPLDERMARGGVDESRNLDFHSPYGCSKGSADQYVFDYGRCYGFKTVVFRMSCICGPHQHGNEDQGWVAHFVRAILRRDPLTIYGDGLQVRDVLFVGDLVRAFRLATAAGRPPEPEVFNIGGGPDRAASVLDVIEQIQQITGVPADVTFAPARTGDQRWYVSNYRRFTEATGWAPKVGLPQAVEALVEWFSEADSLTTAGGDGRRIRCATL